MAKEEKKQEKVKESPSELVIGQEEDVKPSGEVVIELDEKGKEVQQKKEEKPSEEYVRKDELEKERRRIAYEVRKAAEVDFNRVKAELDELKKRQTQAPVQQGSQKDELDEMLAQGNWRTPIDTRAKKVAQETFKELMEQERVARTQEEAYNKSKKLLNDNIQKVYERHPDLKDETSEKASVYRRIVEQNPDYAVNPFGPVLAMRDMEDELKGRGIVDEPTQKIVDKEIARQARTGATTVKPGSGANGNKIVLTKDERDFCDHNNINYASYAASKASLAKGREIEA